MAAPHARRPTRTPDPRRRLVPVGVVVVVYFVLGTLWVAASGPVADAVTEATSAARWVVVLALGVLFVSITTMALALSMRGREEELDTADARTQDADARTDDADARTDQADARTDAANARTHRRARQLAASEDRNRLQATALSGTTTAVMVTGRDGLIEWVNEAFETLSGYPASEAIGATPRLLQSGMHDEEFYRDLWETILAGRVWGAEEMVNRHRDGELYTVSQTITPVAASDGVVHNFVATLEDITDRVRAARDLEASRLRLQSLVDHALDAIVLVDHEGYVEVNPAFCALTGYARDELLGMAPADLAARERQPADVAPPSNAFMPTGTEAGTFALRHKDGHVVETEYRAVADIQPGVHLSVLRDVSERNRMLRALTVAESEFRGLAENAADIVARLRADEHGRLQVDYVNPAATAILGYTPDQLHHDPDLLLELVHHHSDDLDEALDLRPTAAEPVRLATVQVERADGRLVWLEIHSALTDPSTDPATIQLVARDVTARSEMMEALEATLHDQLEAAEQLRRLNAMKDTFLQSVSHELRTPLTSIMGFAHLLADPRLGLSPGNTRDFHARIVSSAERLQGLLDDLLDIDRFTRGQVEPTRAPTDLTALVDGMVHDAGLGDRTIERELAPITMDLDAPWVERLVANLLRNIVRHTPADGRVWIRTRATADGVELIVDDDGPGIPEGDRQRVVEPFQQGVDVASSAQPGTGVGLTLVHTFAQLHGGGLVIAESPAGGTRAIVTLAHAATGSGPATEPVDMSERGASAELRRS